MIWLVGVCALPWVAVAALALTVREPPELEREDTQGAARDSDLPSVRIVVPARNEERNIEACLCSLAAQDYPDFAITVVDDRSTDGTREVASRVAPGNANEIAVVRGAPLPRGWFGKPWACAQGASGASEELILFTDADTLHGPSLLRSAVRALRGDAAVALSLLGRQELGSFGERLVQPQIFTILGLRYRRLDRSLEAADQKNAIANGQYILVRRAAYEEIGGHDSVKGEVVEDLRLAQVLTGAGHRLVLKTDRARFSTRMYQSLREVLDGWTKNVAIGARQSAGWWARLALAAIVGYALVVWVLPPVTLLGAGIATLSETRVAPLIVLWSAFVSAVGVGTWTLIYRRFGVPAGYALLYPIGAAIVGLIALRSGWRGERRVEWKGRRYASGEALGEPL